MFVIERISPLWYHAIHTDCRDVEIVITESGTGYEFTMVSGERSFYPFELEAATHGVIGDIVFNDFLKKNRWRP